MQADYFMERSGIMRYEGAFLSEADGLSISTAAMIPDQKPYRAIVQLVHGMSEH